MILISDLDFSLPFKNPVIIFSLVLFIILFAPIVFNRLKIPHIIGLIIAGIIIGPYGLNLLLRDSSIVLFGTVGLLYIMFTAGLEIDLEEFRKNRLASFVFGLFTFAVPMVGGVAAAYYILRFSIDSSLLFAAMMASHTLLAYPIASKYGVARIRSVTLTIGGTIITDILALLVLAAVTGMTRGDIGTAFWVRLAISTLIFGCVLFLLFPLIARWFFKRFDEPISQYIFVLAMVFLGSFLAEMAGLEAIIGAFLSGLVLNRFIPHSSALMNRIEFVGNAFFIPFFLIGVGMLVDFRVLFKGWESIAVAIVMTLVAIAGKFVAAWLTQKTFRLSPVERQIVFGLSTARVGATLAVVLVGYNIIIGETATGEPIRLLNESVLNGSILMILITCTISSFIVEKASQTLALMDENQAVLPNDNEKILISLAYPETAAELVDLGLVLKPQKSAVPVYALHVISDEDSTGTESAAKKILDKAATQALAAGQTILPLTRHDASISNGIIYATKEQGITDLLIGLHHNFDQNDFLGATTEKILKRIFETVFIYKPVQPLNTLQRMIVVIPPKAELEPGFGHWFRKLTTVAKEAGIGVVFYGTLSVLKELGDLQKLSQLIVKTEFRTFANWDDFLILSREIKDNDLFVIVSSRKGHPSYQQTQDKLPYYLSTYFATNSFLLLYPKQLEIHSTFNEVGPTNTVISDTMKQLNKTAAKKGGFLRGLFGKNKDAE
ncbi:MAG: cation:proton antiporter [Chitinophagaceae bacterium]|nr:MAG: cation:proton antiporter [Chitinophagaceae bacterium]